MVFFSVFSFAFQFCVRLNLTFRLQCLTFYVLLLRGSRDTCYFRFAVGKDCLYELFVRPPRRSVAIYWFTRPRGRVGLLRASPWSARFRHHRLKSIIAAWYMQVHFQLFLRAYSSGTRSGVSVFCSVIKERRTEFFCVYYIYIYISIPVRFGAN